MTTGDFRKPPEGDYAEPLAALLRGLRLRGLAVGPDDAARVASVFRHAGPWPHQRRVRTLKALLARSDDERLVIDQLAPFLFVKATKEADDGARERDRPFPRSEQLKTRAGTRSATGPQTPTEPPHRWRRRALTAASAMLVVAVVFFYLLYRPGGSGFEDTPAAPAAEYRTSATPTDRDVAPEAETDAQGATATDVFPGPTRVTCDVRPPPPPPSWPVWLAFAGVVFSVGYLFWLFWQERRSRLQEANIEALVASTGPRTYRLDYRATTRPLDSRSVREAAFHLCAPSVEAEAPWLDCRRTVEETVGRAGRLVLRYATWREHRPVLFIEDVSPSMSRWPDHGRQLTEAITRQGGEVVHWFMGGTPEVLSRNRDLHPLVELHQVLAGLDEPTIVVLSDARCIDPHRPASQAAWLGALRQATWLHPRGPELWTAGARWLAEQIPVVPLSEEGLLRLATPRREGGQLPPSWRPAQPAHPEDPAASLQLFRTILEDDAFWWLSAGAVLDRVAGLTARMWWAMREDIVPVPLDRAERVWELPCVRVEADGAVTLPEELRESLIQNLETERPDLLAGIVAWAEKLVAGDMAELDQESPAAVSAGATRTRLQFTSPRHRDQGRRDLKVLVAKGYGAWLSSNATLAEQAHWKFKLHRVRSPSWWAWLFAALGVFGLMGAGFLLLSPDLQERFFPPQPDFQLLTISSPPVLFPAEELRFCDRHQLGETVWARVEDQAEQLVGEPAETGAIVWSLNSASSLFATERPASAELYLGYEESAQHGPWQVILQVVGSVRLAGAWASPGDRMVRLDWELETAPEEGAPALWVVERDREEVASLSSRNWVDQPDGDGPWIYRVFGSGPDGRPFRSQEVRMDPPPQPPPSPPALPIRVSHATELPGTVRLTWEVETPPDQWPSEWQIARDNEELARVAASTYDDQPPGSGPWIYTVTALGHQADLYERGERQVEWRLLPVDLSVSPDSLAGTVALTWMPPAETITIAPTEWTILRNQEEIQRTAEQSWEDKPPSSGVWTYQVRGIGTTAHLFSSNEMQIELFDIVSVELTAAADYAENLSLSWTPVSDSLLDPPQEWQLLQNEEEVARLSENQWQTALPSDGALIFRVKGENSVGQAYRSNIIVVHRPVMIKLSGEAKTSGEVVLAWDLPSVIGTPQEFLIVRDDSEIARVAGNRWVDQPSGKRIWTYQVKGIGTGPYYLYVSNTINVQIPLPLKFEAMCWDGGVHLNWGGKRRERAVLSPGEWWRVFRDGEEIAKLREFSWGECPEGNGPWIYLISGVASGELYRSNAVSICGRCCEGSFKIVINADNPTTEIARERLSKMFKKQVKRWANGLSVVAVDQVDKSPVRGAFSEDVHRRNVGGINSYWERMIDSGKEVPPDQLSSDAEVLAFVKDESGGLGYVSICAELPSGVKELQVTE